MIPVEEADMVALWLSSMGGVAHLAHELEQQRLSDPSESLEDARQLMPVIEQAVEDARRGL